MASKERIENLKKYCEQWEQSLENAEKQRDQLIELKNSGVSAVDNNGEELLPIMIEEADKAAIIYKKILIKMEALRDRATSGEDV